jgi:translation initiation factor 2 subunit 2
MDYESSLDRALDSVTEVGDAGQRLSVPDPVAQTDGAFTRFTNIGDVADALARDTDHLHRTIQRDLGTSGQLEDGVARYSGGFSAQDLQDALDDYVERYVTCSECGLPDTRLVTEGRTQMLRCDACGAFRPVAKQPRQSGRQDSGPAVEEGETYQVKITGTGRKGDGVAEREQFTIFVPGAREGDVVDIYVEKVSGTLAFARRVQ